MMSEQDQIATFSPDQPGAEAAVLKAAKAGNAEAQFRLGVMYGIGDGVALDYGQARIWFEKHMNGRATEDCVKHLIRRMNPVRGAGDPRAYDGRLGKMIPGSNHNEAAG